MESVESRDDVEEFAALLRRLKARTDRSYGSLARRLNMNTSTLHRYCAGEAVPQEFAPVDRLAAFCAATPEERLELHRLWLLAVAARQRPRTAPAPTGTPKGASAGAEDSGTAASDATASGGTASDGEGPGTEGLGTEGLGAEDSGGQGSGAEGPGAMASGAKASGRAASDGEGPGPEGPGAAESSAKASGRAASGAEGPDAGGPGAVASGAAASGAAASGVNRPGAVTSEAQQPSVEQLGTKRPGAEPPGAVASDAEQPGAAAAGAEQPGAEQLGAEEPGVEQPGAAASGAKAAFAEASGTAASGAERPGAAASGAERPSAAASGAERPATEADFAERPSVEQPGTKQSGSEQAGTEQAGTEQAGAEQAGAEQAGTEQPGTEQPGTEQAGSEQAGSEQAGVEVGRAGWSAARQEEVSALGGVGVEPEVTVGRPGAAVAPRPWYRRRRILASTAVACALLATLGGLSALGTHRSSDTAGPPASVAPRTDGAATPHHSSKAKPKSKPSSSSSPGGAHGSTSPDTGKKAPGSSAEQGADPTGAGRPAAGLPLTWHADSQVWQSGCGHDYVIDRTPAQVPPPPVQQDAGTWAATQGAVHGRQTLVQISVQGRSSTAVVLEALRVRVVSRGTPASGNAYAMDQGCGGELTPRSFTVNLDADRPVARPKDGADSEHTIPAVHFPYRVSAEDPEVLLVDATTQIHDARWYLELDWSSQGRSGTLRIDDHGRPFHTSGIQGKSRYWYGTNGSGERAWVPYGS